MLLCIDSRWVLCPNGLARTKRSLFQISRFLKKTKSKIKYPDCDSAITLVPHSNKYPVPEPPSVLTGFDSESEASINAETSSALEFDTSTTLERTSSKLHVLSQGDLQDLVRDLNLSKEKSEILASQLKQWKYFRKV